MTMELARPVVEQRRCALYRHFDENDVLLYVGITESLGDRTNSGHARTSDWVQFALRAEAEWYDSREQASTAERCAVRAERPVFNRQYAECDVDRQILDYLHDREIRELRGLLGAYRSATETLLAAMPAADIKEATTRARHDYFCAEQQLDEQYSASILRHLAHIVRDRTADITEEATAVAYYAVAGFLEQQFEAMRQRQAAADEAPF